MTPPTDREPLALRGNILLGTSLERGVVVVAAGRIAEVHRGDVSVGNLPPSVIDVDIVTPGLIDLQVNGAIGLEVGDQPGDIDSISRWSASSGVTAWLPTVVTAAADWYQRVFAAWPGVDVMAGAVPLGLHLEGPFLSPVRKGAHRIEYITGATDDIFDAFLAEDAVRLVTLAPEREGALDRIRRLVDRGIVVSLGHTDATFEQFIAGIDAGASKATHLYNTMSPVHHRKPGAIVASLLDKRITAGLIPDAVHSDPAMVRLALRSKGIDGIATVSDMMSACGLGPGTYPLSGREVILDDTSAHLADGTLAGSVLPMDQAVRNLVSWGGVTFGEAIATATASPARILDDRTRGRIGVGTRADLAVWDRHHTVVCTYVGGRERFSRAD